MPNVIGTDEALPIDFTSTINKTVKSIQTAISILIVG